MPFKSQAQERAAFSGALGPKMKAAAPEWASKTNQKSLSKKIGRGKAAKNKTPEEVYAAKKVVPKPKTKKETSGQRFIKHFTN